jgi:serine protease Do
MGWHFPENSSDKRARRNQRTAFPPLIPVVVACLCLAGAANLAAQAPSSSPPDSIVGLQQFSDSVQALAARVSPSVVQILVTRYSQREPAGGASLVVGKQEVVGSGVIVDPEGYVMTNDHVVEGAESIMVRLSPKGTGTIRGTLAQFYAQPQKATLVGSFKEGDLALLKIAGTGLPALQFADYRKLRQGEVVFTLGSPEGLQNSMSMGIVSSIARQPDPDSPWIYIQTDAPINPGDSGGPLVNAEAKIVGLNTFIVSESGGSEGIGFAIPSTLVQWAYGQIRKYGHVHRPMMGLGVQAITPLLAAALKLPRSSGVVVSDVLPHSPADSAGVKINDVLLSMDRVPLDNVAAMLGATMRYGGGHVIRLQVLRGDQTVSVDVTPVETPDEPSRLTELLGRATSAVPRLRILAFDVNGRTASLVGDLRIPSGVLVAARLDEPGGIDTGLQAGDVIHGINGASIQNVEELRSKLAQLRRGDPVALQIERNGRLQYEAFLME